MLAAHPASTEPDASPGAGDPLRQAKWVDLLDPTPEEIARVEAAFHLRLPSREALSEIEATSRLQVRDGVLYMSAPLITGVNLDVWDTTPVGFVLCQDACITLRFARLDAFEAVAASFDAGASLRSDEVFARVLEEVVDRVADHLEATSETLNRVSLAIFHSDAKRKSKLTRDTNKLRQAMTEIGRASERMSHARYTLVCMGRMAQFAADRARGWMSPATTDQLQGVKADVASLEQFEEHLLGRVQLLQDAATAFISIEQNDVVKVLTIASVVGIPPVLVVGIYGMNFKVMPELNWTWGYPYALALIVVSTVVPLVWFKLKDWM